MKKMRILGLIIALLMVFSIGSLAQENQEKEKGKESLPKAYLRTIPPEILKQYDSKVLSGERPSFAFIKNEDIWDLRGKAKIEKDFVSFSELDIDQLSPIQIKIVQEWVKRGAKVYVKDEYSSEYTPKYRSVVSKALPRIFGITVKDLGIIGLSVYFNKAHPVNTGVKGLPVGEEFKFLEAGPSGIVGSRFIVTGLPKESSVIVSLDEAQSKAFVGYFKYGEGTVYFNTLLLPWPGFDYNSDRFRLNLGQWLIGKQIPGLISEKEMLGFLAPSKGKPPRKEKAFPAKISRRKAKILNIEKREDTAQIQRLKYNPTIAGIVSIRCPRRDISQTDINILKEWVKKSNVILLWSKPEYLADETIGFVGDDFGLRSKKSNTCYGKLVVTVTQRCPLTEEVGKLLVFIPGIAAGEKASYGYVYSDGFNYILAKHGEEAIIVIRKVGEGWIIGLPWQVDEDSFDGERFWANLRESPAFIKSSIFNDTTIKLYSGEAIRGMFCGLCDEHIVIEASEYQFIIPWRQIQSIKTANFCARKRLLAIAPEKLQLSQVKQK